MPRKSFIDTYLPSKLKEEDPPVEEEKTGFPWDDNPIIAPFINQLRKGKESVREGLSKVDEWGMRHLGPDAPISNLELQDFVPQQIKDAASNPEWGILQAIPDVFNVMERASTTVGKGTMPFLPGYGDELDKIVPLDRWELYMAKQPLWKQQQLNTPTSYLFGLFNITPRQLLAQRLLVFGEELNDNGEIVIAGTNIPAPNRQLPRESAVFPAGEAGRTKPRTPLEQWGQYLQQTQLSSAEVIKQRIEGRPEEDPKGTTVGDVVWDILNIMDSNQKNVSEIEAFRAATTEHEKMWTEKELPWYLDLMRFAVEEVPLLPLWIVPIFQTPKAAVKGVGLVKTLGKLGIGGGKMLLNQAKAAFRMTPGITKTDAITIARRQKLIEEGISLLPKPEGPISIAKGKRRLKDFMALVRRTPKTKRQALFVAARSLKNFEQQMAKGTTKRDWTRVIQTLEEADPGNKFWDMLRTNPDFLSRLAPGQLAAWAEVSLKSLKPSRSTDLSASFYPLYQKILSRLSAMRRAGQSATSLPTPRKSHYYETKATQFKRGLPPEYFDISSEAIERALATNNPSAMPSMIKHISIKTQQRLDKLGYSLEDIASMTALHAAKLSKQNLVDPKIYKSYPDTKHLPEAIRRKLAELGYRRSQMRYMEKEGAKATIKNKVKFSITPEAQDRAIMRIADWLATHVHPRLKERVAYVRSGRHRQTARLAAITAEIQKHNEKMLAAKKMPMTPAQAAKLKAKGRKLEEQYKVVSEGAPKLEKFITMRGGPDTLSTSDKHIINHMLRDAPEDFLTPHERANVQTVWRNLVTERHIPTLGDVKLLEKALGIVHTRQLIRGATGSLWKRKNWKALATELFHLPRALKSSFDLSASFNQGGLLAASHPKEWSRAFRSQLKALTNETYAINENNLMKGVIGDPASRRHAMWRTKHGLFISDLEGAAGVLKGREEAYMSRLLQLMAGQPWWHPVGLVGKGVRASERAYVTFLNKLRVDVFDNVVHGWRRSGKKVERQDFKDLAQMINRFTGRGELSMKEFKNLGRVMPPSGAHGFLNAVFFSPRFQTSRITSFSSLTAKSSLVRKEAWANMGWFMGSRLSILTMIAAHPDIQVDNDPRSADFGVIKWGNYRFSFWSGFQTLARFLASVGYSVAQQPERVSATTGIPRDITLWDLSTQFMRGKTNPPIGGVLDLLTERTFTGDELWTQTRAGEDFLDQVVRDGFAPMFIDDALEAIEEYGLFQGSAMSIPSLLGMKQNTYNSALQSVIEISTRYNMHNKAKTTFKEELANVSLDKEREFGIKFYRDNPEIMWNGSLLGETNRRNKRYEELIKLFKNTSLNNDQKKEITEYLQQEMINKSIMTILVVEDIAKGDKEFEALMREYEPSLKEPPWLNEWLANN